MIPLLAGSGALPAVEAAVPVASTAAPTLGRADFAGLYAAHARPLWAYLRRVCGDPELADDLVQESFVRLLRQGVAPRAGTDLKSYLYKTATHLAVDQFRAAGRRLRWFGRRLEDEDDDAVADLPAAADVERDVLRRHDLDRAFARLRPQERALLWLAYAEGMEHREIAAALGLKVESIRVLLFRARKKMAGLLGGQVTLDAGATP